MKGSTIAGLTGLAVAVALFPASAGAQIPARSFKADTSSGDRFSRERTHQVLPEAPEIVVTDAPGRRPMGRIAEVSVSPGDVADVLVRKGLARVNRATSGTRRTSSPARIATSFAQLSLQELPRDRVHVTTCTGATIRAKIAGLSPSSLTLRVDSALHRLSEDEACLIERRRSDSLWNGIGNGVGMGFLGGLFTGAAICRCEEGAALLGLGGMALGAGLGAGIDATIQERAIIYRKTIRPVGTSNDAVAQIHQ